MLTVPLTSDSFRLRGAQPPRAAADSAAGAAQPDPQDEGARVVRQIPGFGTVGGELGPLRRDLPVRAQAAAELRPGAQASSGVHMGEDIRSGQCEYRVCFV